MSSAVRSAYEHAVTSGMQHIFTAGAIIAVAALVAAVLIEEIPLRGKPSAPVQPSANPSPRATVTQTA